MLIKHFIIPVLGKGQNQFILICFYGLGIGILVLVSPWLGLAAVIGLLFLLVILSRPVYLCYLVILATVFTSGMGRGRIIPYLVPNEVVLGLVSIMALPAILINNQPRSSTNSGSITTGIVILLAGTSIFPLLIYFARGVGLSVSELFSLIAPLQYALVYLVFRYLPLTEAEVRSIVRLMLVSAAVVGIVGLLQTMRLGFILNFLNTWYPSSHQETALSYGRVSSVLGAWNSLGTFLMLNLIILRAVSILQPALMNRVIFFLIAASGAGCLIASGSYASLVGLALGFFLFELFDRRGRTTMVFLFLIIPILAFLLRDNIMARFAFQTRYGGLIPATLAFRFQLWESVFWPIIRKTWLWGFHPIIPSTVAWQYAESQYITLLIRSGIFSLLAHLFWVGLTLVWLYKNIRASDDFRRSLSISVFIMLVVLSIMAVTNAVFYYSSVSEYLWISLGLIGSLGEEHKHKMARSTDSEF